MVLGEDFERLKGDLAVEEEVLVVQDEEEGGGAGAEVFQAAALDAEGAVAALVGDAKSMVVNLGVLDASVKVWV